MGDANRELGCLRVKMDGKDEQRYVLYCEDDNEVQQEISEILNDELKPCKVVAAASLEEAIKKATPIINSIRCVITDGKLGNESCGWDVAEKLKSLGYNGTIVYCGTTALPEDKRHFFSCSMNKVAIGRKSMLDILKDYINQ